MGKSLLSLPAAEEAFSITESSLVLDYIPVLCFCCLYGSNKEQRGFVFCGLIRV